MTTCIEFEKSVSAIIDWKVHCNSSQSFPYCDLSYSPLMFLDSLIIQSCRKGSCHISLGLTGNLGASAVYSGLQALSGICVNASHCVGFQSHEVELLLGQQPVFITTYW